jgi:hypothetical protein
MDTRAKKATQILIRDRMSLSSATLPLVGIYQVSSSVLRRKSGSLRLETA